MPKSKAEPLNALVVDDDPIVVSIIADVLSRYQHQTVTASSAEEILKLLPYWTFQVAFIDHHLPGMDGLVLAEYLTRTNPDTKVALVTGETNTRLEKRTRDAGLSFISKPFSASDILDVIDSYRAFASEKAMLKKQTEDETFVPAFARYLETIADCFGVPSVPSRVEDRIVRTVKTALNAMRLETRYSERDRIIALSGLLASRVLSINLPNSSSGLSLFEEYDELMTLHGRRTEFAAKD